MRSKFWVRSGAFLAAALLSLSLIACEKNTAEDPQGSSVPRTTSAVQAGDKDAIAVLPVGEFEETSGEEDTTPEETGTAPAENETAETAVPAFHDAENVLEHYGRVFVVTERESVYVRTAPQSAGEIIGVIPLYGGGTIIQNSVDAKWVEVESGTLRGYISAGYITTGDAGKEAAKKYARERVRITADVAYIMLQPSEDSSKLATVFPDNVYDYLGEDGDYYEILLSDGVNGYVRKDSCEQGLFLLEARAQKMNGVNVVLNAFGCSEDAGNSITGVYSGTPAYKLNLKIAERVKKELEARGYMVYMVRKGDSCTLDGKGRARAANDYGATVVINIKCGKSDNKTTAGISTYSIAADNEQHTKAEYDTASVLSNVLSERTENATGTKCIGRNKTNEFDELNYSEATAVILQVGYLSNEDEDRKLNDEAYQSQIANGVANGLDRYYGFKR